MAIIPRYELVIPTSTDDLFSKRADWKRNDSSQFALAKTSCTGCGEHRAYAQAHTWTWKLSQGIWAAIQTLLSLGLALISDYSRRTWQQAISGKEYAVVHIKSKPVIPLPLPVTPPVRPLTPSPKPPVITDKPSVKPAEVVPPVLKTPAKIQFNPDVAGILVSAETIDLTSFSKADRDLYNAIDMTFNTVNSIENNVGKKTENTAQSQWDAKAPVPELLRVFNEILIEFQKPKYQQLYGACPQDQYLFRSQVGDPVPEYYANVANQTSTSYSVLYRGMLGMRNLIKFGAKILDELDQHLFIAGRAGYPDGVGLKNMFELTGNAVDLEWPICSCPVLYDSRGHLLMDPVNDAKAKQAAQKLIDVFKQRFSDHAAKFTQRNLDNWTDPVHESTSNLDRGNYPVWKRDVRGTYHYFVNVPNISAVVSALLKGPLYFVQSYLILKNKGLDLGALFGPESLSQKCFNDKLEVAEVFNFSCKEHLRPTHKSLMIAQYGQAAVESALTSADMEMFINDEAILPKVNEAATAKITQLNNMRNGPLKDTALSAWISETKKAHLAKLKEWKPAAVEAYLRKVERIGWNNVLYFDGTKYVIFEPKLFILNWIDRIVLQERSEAEGGMAEAIRFL